MTILKKKKKPKKRLGVHSSRLGNGTVRESGGAGPTVGGYYGLDIHVVSLGVNTLSCDQAAGGRSGEDPGLQSSQGGKSRNSEEEEEELVTPLPPPPPSP